MTTTQRILEEIADLRGDEQSEILDFVAFLKTRRARLDEHAQQDFSLSTAMRGMEDEPDLYTVEDIKEPR